MRNTITTDLHMQAMTCGVCAQDHEVPRRLMRDQDGLLDLQDEIARDHRECAEVADRPELWHMARLSREFRKRHERELAKEARRQRERLATAA